MNCPKCKTSSLVEKKVKNSATLRVDQCSACKGVWFDEDEIDAYIPVKRGVMTIPHSARRSKKCPTAWNTRNEAKPVTSTVTDAESASYANDIPGLKGRALRFVDLSISRLWDQIQRRD